jgi:FlaA1/EpsC-like NDP-sugar epimerase
MNILKLLDRHETLFKDDIHDNDMHLNSLVTASRFLVIGGAGTIGQAVTKELFKRNPKTLHVVDISENNLVELVREIRSTIGYNDADFRTFAIDCGSRAFLALMESGVSYDYIFNLSALKHVRSEKDPFTLMRMIEVKILNTIVTLKLSKKLGVKKYFCVSTDKAANPVNMMGASKRIMEMFLMRYSHEVQISTARFANVAFSDGSLLHGFTQRLSKGHPISAPDDVKRYFITPQESGELCLMSCLLGSNRDIFFPKLTGTLNLTKFSDIAARFLRTQGYEPYVCNSEDEARHLAANLISAKKWPVFFFQSDTTGEKDFEEFYTEKEKLDLDQYKSMGVILNELEFDENKLSYFLQKIEAMIESKKWEKKLLVSLFEEMIPDFRHLETGKYLDSRM